MKEKKGLLPDDILIGFFAKFPKNKRFKWDRESFNRFFYEKKSEYPNLLECLLFRKREFPESEGLDQAYKNLIYTDLLVLSSYNLLHQPNVDRCKKSLKKYLHFSSSERCHLKKMANEYVTKFGSD